ncbi:MAG: hypothetical protein PHS97_06990 [Oscillospiraceae bacterium]|nr:hypothetical protein [Oscillospiraceae bacterium]
MRFFIFFLQIFVFVRAYLAAAYPASAQGAAESGIWSEGVVQTIYRKKPPNRGANTADCITQIALPGNNYRRINNDFFAERPERASCQSQHIGFDLP